MKTTRYIVSIVIAFAAIQIAELAIGGRAFIFVNLTTLLIMTLGPLIILRGTWTFREMGEAFRSVMTISPDAGGRKRAELFFGQVRRSLYLIAGIGSILSLGIYLAKLDDIAKLGPSLAIVLSSLLYALAADFILATPLQTLARRGL